jgi:hypothetical protein
MSKDDYARQFLRLPLKQRRKLVVPLIQRIEASVKDKEKFEAGSIKRYRNWAFQAMVLREEGRNKDALKALDEALRAFKCISPDVALRRKPGRPPGAKNKSRDPDQWTLGFMQWLSKETGVSDAETLAKHAAELIGVMPSIHRGASKTAFIKRVSGKFRRLAKK